MGSLGIKLLFSFFLVFSVIAENNGQRGFLNLVTGTAKNMANQTTGIINEGIKTQMNLISQVPSYFRQAYQTVQDSVLRAAENPATIAANALLKGANAFIKLAKKDTIPLPEVKTSIYGFGSFEANGGRLMKLSTLSTNGSVKLRKSGMFLSIDIPFKLGELKVEYTNYTLATWGATLNGSVLATIGKNAFVIRLQLEGSVDCNINLLRVEVESLEGIEVSLQGSMSSFLSSAATYVASYLQGNIIQPEVQKALDDLLTTYIKNNYKPICTLFTSLNIF